MQTIHRPGNWARISWFLRFVRSREGNEEAVRSLRHETPEMRENCCIEGFELLWMYYYDILFIWLWCNDNSDSKAFAVWQTFAATVQIGTMEWEDWRSSIFSSFCTFFPNGMRTAGGTWGNPGGFQGDSRQLGEGPRKKHDLLLILIWVGISRYDTRLVPGYKWRVLPMPAYPTAVSKPFWGWGCTRMWTSRWLVGHPGKLLIVWLTLCKAAHDWVQQL